MSFTAEVRGTVSSKTYGLKSDLLAIVEGFACRPQFSSETTQI